MGALPLSDVLATEAAARNLPWSRHLTPSERLTASGRRPAVPFPDVEGRLVVTVLARTAVVEGAGRRELVSLDRVLVDPGAVRWQAIRVSAQAKAAARGRQARGRSESRRQPTV
jgi:hypothetical protein